MPITLLSEKFDVSELLSIYNSIDHQSQQIYITSLDGNTYSYDSMKMKEYMAEGKAYLLNDMTKINELFKDSYLEDVKKDQFKKFKL